MSFSSDAKNELVKIKNAALSASMAELMGAVAFGGKLKRDEKRLTLHTVTENPKVARRIYQLLKECVGVTSKIKINKTAKNNVYYQVYIENEDVIAMRLAGHLGRP